MAKTAKTFRVVKPNRSSAQRPAPTKEDMEEARLQEYQQMYREVEQVVRLVEAHDNSDSIGGSDRGMTRQLLVSIRKCYTMMTWESRSQLMR